MKRLLTAAACMAMLAACNPDGADTRQTGAADDYDTRIDDVAGRNDTSGISAGTPGIGTTGATGNMSGDTRGATGADAGGTGQLTEAAILSRLAVANQSEIQEAQLAQRQAASAQVKELARTLERDHSANLTRVKSLQESVESDPDARARAVEETDADNSDLAGKTGAEFDSAFLDRQESLHEENIRKLEEEFLPSAQDAELRTHIEQTIPTLRQHLASIRRLNEQQ